MKLLISFLILVLLIGCAPVEPKDTSSMNLTETATFAGGCFWCMEAAFEALDGVSDVVSGFSGGETENPTYNQVISGTTGHLETVEFMYDSTIISYEELVEYFWRNIDPFDSEGQFVDKGAQYGTAIFYHDEVQKEIADNSKKKVEEKFNQSVVTIVIPAEEFYQAEEYHQDYYKKKLFQYEAYKTGSGRKSRLGKLWE
jgi:methionine-S-sulfoxide reductase